MGNCHFKTDFDAENITGKPLYFINLYRKTSTIYLMYKSINYEIISIGGIYHNIVKSIMFSKNVLYSILI